MKPWWLLALLWPSLALAENGYDPDPWEDFNRRVFAFNEVMDEYVARPLAVGYQAVTPKDVDDSVTHFFSNLEDVIVIINDLGQLKFGQAASDTARFLVNSTVGFFGVFDVATHIGLPKHDEDFGQTLGYWGVGTGPYIMLPILGPSTLRDGAGDVIGTVSGVDYLSIPDTNAKKLAAYGVRNIDVRAGLLASEGLITGDRYTFVRSFYLQRREFLVNDGESSDNWEEDSWDDDVWVDDEWDDSLEDDIDREAFEQ
ncbi:VacJ family lipoprotein [Bacterioplanes sanyensis]|nr:VacJ family lipoprotein [Bacterioplanes sanyensis]